MLRTNFTNFLSLPHFQLLTAYNKHALLFLLGDREVGHTHWCPWGGTSAGYTQLHTCPGQNSAFVKRFHWRCFNICFFTASGLRHPVRKWKITFFPPFQSMPTTSLADTGSKAAHRNLSPIPGSPLTDYNCAEAVTGRSDGSAAMQEGTPLPRLPAQTLLQGAKTALLPAVPAHQHHIPWGKAAWSPYDRGQTQKMIQKLVRELKSEARLPKPKVYIRCCIIFPLH